MDTVSGDDRCNVTYLWFILFTSRQTGKWKQCQEIYISHAIFTRISNKLYCWLIIAIINYERLISTLDRHSIISYKARAISAQVIQVENMYIDFIVLIFHNILPSPFILESSIPLLLLTYCDKLAYKTSSKEGLVFCLECVNVYTIVWHCWNFWVR